VNFIKNKGLIKDLYSLPLAIHFLSYLSLLKIDSWHDSWKTLSLIGNFLISVNSSLKVQYQKAEGYIKSFEMAIVVL